MRASSKQVRLGGRNLDGLACSGRASLRFLPSPQPKPGPSAYWTAAVLRCRGWGQLTFPGFVPAPRPSVTAEKGYLAPHSVLTLESRLEGGGIQRLPKTRRSRHRAQSARPPLGGEGLRGSGVGGKDVPSYRGPWGTVGSCRGTVLQGLAACLPGNHTGRERGLKR